MSTSPVAGLMSFLHRMFPHRQFYLRSRGSVQFFEFSPTFQMTIAFVSLVVLGWVAYASVVVIFKEQIITAKDQRYASMQTAYESRVSQMQLAYDELNGLLVLAEERFQNATRDLEAKLAAIDPDRPKLVVHVRPKVRKRGRCGRCGELASWFELQVKGDRRLELCAPREKGSPLVCFRLRGAGESPKEAAELDARNRAFHAAINGTGKLYLSHTTLSDHTRPMNAPRYVLRMAIGGTFTKHEHVEAAWRVIAEMAGGVTA